ncbi:hypothetical protein DAPPUDRAFT_256468 [Daphnia pulex]|uniref:Uncharacterized protein n=1 Tax=Daphnia pulex TaxID=6669 RepID=E9HBF6_DAPPU|nr:hypothetical protein DAPPUDRAFT_256468 [Daphnia pulex]|eukprot:EFX70925.1 hypothetical protein DAPPUDRAFT_256468 [Daphnia pulex]
MKKEHLSKKCLSQDKMEDPRTLGYTLMGLTLIHGSCIKLAIQSEELWDIVSPTEPKPQLLAVGKRKRCGHQCMGKKKYPGNVNIFSSIKEEKSRLLMSCTLGQEMWTKMETAYSESAADSSLLLRSRFYGCKFLPGQTVLEFITEIEQVVSRLRAIIRIVLLDEQIIVKVTMSLPPSLKLIFKAEWESAVTAERTLSNLTTRLVQMEKEINESEKESDALLSKRVNPTEPI